MSRVTLSAKHARALLDAVGRVGTNIEQTRAVEELRRQLASRPKSSAVRKTERKRRDKRAETQTVRAAVFERAGGRCEFDCGFPATDLHHAFGRVRVAQSESNCIALCRLCHRGLTENVGGAEVWWERVAKVFGRRHNHTEAQLARNRLAFVQARKGGA